MYSIKVPLKYCHPESSLRKRRTEDKHQSTHPEMFGLYPRKGVIAPGSDADVVIYDPAGRTEIGYEKTHHMNMDHSAWEGFNISGHVDTVISRGTVVVDNNEYKGTKGHGKYLKRGMNQYLV